jgi:hypothetical protein
LVVVWSFLAILSGCSGGGAGPDFAVSPQYKPTGQLNAAGGGNKTPVAVAVVDSRTSKGRTRSDGNEVITEGDKGKIYLSRPVTKVVEDSLTSALKSAGFTVAPEAAVVVEVDVVDLPVQAYQFTHWNLPSERASTLDALGAVVPGPVRPTTAKANMNVIVRKHDTRLGFNHVVGAEVTNKSADRGVVEQTMDEAISKAVDEAVAKAAPDVEIVNRTPVTAREIDGREGEILKQQQAIKELGDMLAKREALLTEDKKAMDEMRQRLVEDQRQGQESLAADRKALEDQRTQIKSERDALAAKVAELNSKPKEDPEAKEALLAAQKQQQELDARSKSLEQASTELDSRKKTIEEREQNLAAYSAKLDDQSKANQALAAELKARQGELADREAALKKWKQDLEARAAVKPTEQIVGKRRPLILITDPAASRTETTLPQITVSGVAIDNRQVASLKATVNGQPVADVTGAGVSSEDTGRGVGIRSVTTGAGGTAATADGSEQSLASKRINFTAPLKEGLNEIVIDVINDDSLKTTEKLTVNYDKGAGRIHIITIGINDYQNKDSVPPLQYAVADAKEVAETFEHLLSASTGKRIRELLNGQATRANLVRQLFEQLPSEVRPSDTVVIFFSGHGAPDASTDAQGNVETFLLPIDADPQKLFSTAIRMNDVGTILRRLRSERIVFLADTCYSGAAAVGINGAKSVGIAGVAMRGGVGLKAIPERPRGKGVAVMTASTGIQVAQEKQDVGHGVFTHYLLKGLQGAADANHDGRVTVDELYEYVRNQVSAATNGKQTPQISRDPTAGDIVLSNVTTGPSASK